MNILFYIFIFFLHNFLYSNNSGVCTSEQQYYKSAQKAFAAKKTILHCGKCGACSNIDDIKEYYNTRETMTKISTKCAFKLIRPFNGREKATKCMAKKVNLTPKCLDCWIDNMQCTKQNCLFKCLLSTITGRESFHKDCLECDENKCGQQFLNCAGANRRNSGIITDISRDTKEICPYSNIKF